MGTMGLSIVLSTRAMLTLCGLSLGIATALQYFINRTQLRKQISSAQESSGKGPALV